MGDTIASLLLEITTVEPIPTAGSRSAKTDQIDCRAATQETAEKRFKTEGTADALTTYSANVEEPPSKNESFRSASMGADHGRHRFDHDDFGRDLAVQPVVQT